MEYVTPVTFVALQDKNATVVEATALVGSELFTATGSSKREQGDQFDEELGLLLATARAVEDLGRQMRARGKRRVKAAYPASAEQGLGDHLARVRSSSSEAALSNFRSSLANRLGVSLGVTKKT